MRKCCIATHVKRGFAQGFQPSREGDKHTCGFCGTITEIKNGEWEVVAIECPKCKMVSHNKGDIENLYCGKCHEFREPVIV